LTRRNWYATIAFNTATGAVIGATPGGHDSRDVESHNLFGPPMSRGRNHPPTWAMASLGFFLVARGEAIMRKRLNFPAFIGEYVRPDERDALLTMAERDQMTISQKIRELIMQEAQRDLRKGKEPAGVDD
jgi:hypothetical protein